MTGLGVGAKSLARGSTFAKPRSGLRRGRRKTGGFGGIAEGACVFAGMGGIECSEPMDPHHLLKQQWIERRFPHGAFVMGDETRVAAPRVLTDEQDALPFVSLALILRDPRLIRLSCRDHHVGWHWSRFVMPREALPAELFEFVDEYGLWFELERQYPVEAWIEEGR